MLLFSFAEQYQGHQRVEQWVGYIADESSSGWVTQLTGMKRATCMLWGFVLEQSTEHHSMRVARCI